MMCWSSRFWTSYSTVFCKWNGMRRCVWATGLMLGSTCNLTWRLFHFPMPANSCGCFSASVSIVMVSVSFTPTTLVLITPSCDEVWWLRRDPAFPFVINISFFFQSVLHWSVAVSTICCNSSRVVAFLQAVARPKFRGPMSASITRSQVWLDIPAVRFQLGGTCRIHAATARWWSSNLNIWASVMRLFYSAVAQNRPFNDSGILKS